MSRYIIIEKDPIVADDLSGAIRDIDGGAVIVIADGIDAAVQTVSQSLLDVGAVVAHANRQAIEASGLGDVLRRAGLSLIHVGSAPDRRGDSDPDWVPLEVPFSTDMVRHAIAQARQSKA